MAQVLSIVIFIIMTMTLDTSYGAVDPLPADCLGETMECRFTPELNELAAKLGHDPVKIYNWVYENIEYEDYYYSRKGAQCTYLTKKGNDWDIASLLIALLRISGIPARYMSVISLSSYNYEMGVEAWVSMASYRGMPGNQDMRWAPLAVHSKEYQQIQPGLTLFAEGIPAAMNFDHDYMKNDYMKTVKQKTVLEIFEEKMQDYLDVNYKGKTLKDVPQKSIIVKRQSDILPGTLPNTFMQYSLYAGRDIFAEIPDNCRVEITLYFRRKSDDAIILQRIIYLPEIAGRRFCLDFVPSGNLTKPVLKIDGNIIAEGHDLNIGEEFYPAYEGGGYSYTKRPPHQAGTFMQMAFDPLSASEETIEKMKIELKDIPTTVAYASGTREEYLGRVANILITTFLYRKHAAITRATELLYCKRNWYNSVCPTFIYAQPTALNSIGNSIETKFMVHPQWNIDAQTQTGLIYRADGSELDWLDPLNILCRNLYMYSSSYNEGLIFEDWQDTLGIGTVKGIMLANEQNIDVLKIDQSNMNTELPKLDAQLRAIVQEEIDQANTVIIPSQILQYAGMTGYVYVSFGPEVDSYSFSFNQDEGGMTASYSEPYDVYNDYYTAIMADPSSYTYDMFLNAQGLTPHTSYNSNDWASIQDQYFINIPTSQASSVNAIPINNTGAEASLYLMGDPVDMVTGEFYQQEQPDIQVKSRGVDMSVRRKYRSQLVFDGPFGYGWTWNHAERLLILKNKDVIYFDNDSSPYYLTYNPHSISSYEYLYYDCPAGTTFKLEEDGTDYVLIKKHNDKCYFNSKGLLTKKEDPYYSNALTFEYNQEDQLISITDPLGRKLTFLYNSSGKVIAASDFAGRRCYYSYDGDDLVQFTDLEGNITKYEYLKNQENVLNNHNMSRYILPNGDFLDIGYYKNDQVAYHRNKQEETFNFQYSRLNRYAETWNEAGYYRKVFFNEQNDVIRVDNEDGTVELDEYDQNHNMTSHTDAKGNTTLFEYDLTNTNRNLISIKNALRGEWKFENYRLKFNKPRKATDPKGNVTTFEYNDQGSLTKKIDALNKETTYGYDSFGNNTLVTDAFKYTIINTYDPSGLNLLAAKDKNNNVTSYAYDAIGNMIATTDPDGYTTKYQYNNYNQMTQVTDALGNVTRYKYDQNRKLTKVIAPNEAVTQNIYGSARDIVSGAKLLQAIDQLGNSEYFDYDAVGNMIAKTDKNGNTTVFAYDAQGRLIQETDPYQNTVFHIIDGNGNITEEVDKRGNRTLFTHDDANRVLTKTDPKGNTTTYNYDKNGNLTDEIKPNGDITHYEYDVLNRVLKKSIGYNGYDSRVFQYEYDALARVSKEIYPLGNYTIYEYDGNGNKTKEIYYDRNGVQEMKKIVYTYNSCNLMVSMVEDNGINNAGAGYKYTYDALGRKISETDPVGNVIRYEYDSVGNLTKVTDPAGVTGYFYDLANHLIKTVDALGHATCYQYDNNGNTIAVIDAEKNGTTTYYDALNRKIGVIDALDAQTTFDYDENSNLVSVNDANKGSTLYEYDANNLKSKMTRPMGQITTYTYDAVGNLYSVIDAKGQKITYSYNTLMLPIYVAYYASGNYSTQAKGAAFCYDLNGNLCSYSDGTTSAGYYYDDLNRKTYETINYGTFTKSYSYSYPNNWRGRFTGPSGVIIDYTYDGAKRLTAVTIPNQGQIVYSNHKWNRPGTITLPSNNIIDCAYDAEMRPVSINESSGLMTRGYEYSPAGNITDKSTEHGNYAYGYDKIYQLINAANPTVTGETYVYDLLGNRTTAFGTANGTYNANNEIQAYNAMSFAHDANGNMTGKTSSGTTFNYIYNVENRLVEVKKNNATIAKYYYDPFGRRLWKEINGIKTYFVYSDEGLIAECNSTGDEIKTYGYALGNGWSTAPLFQQQSGNYYWYLKDHMGTPQKIVDNNGLVVWSAVYESFGKVNINTNTIENNLRFGGQYFDKETGLHYNLNRYYDPFTGRYLRTDPAEDGLNLYAYANNNPLISLDPAGLEASSSGGIMDRMFDFSWWGNAAQFLGGKGWAWGYDNLYADMLGVESFSEMSMGDRLWSSYSNLMGQNSAASFYLEHSEAFMQGALNAYRGISMFAGGVPPTPAVATAGMGAFPIAVAPDLMDIALGLGGTTMMAQSPPGGVGKKVTQEDVSPDSLAIGTHPHYPYFSGKFHCKLFCDFLRTRTYFADYIVDVLHQAKDQIWAVIDGYNPFDKSRGFSLSSGETMVFMNDFGASATEITPAHGAFSFELFNARVVPELWDKIYVVKDNIWIPPPIWLENPPWLSTIKF